MSSSDSDSSSSSAFLRLKISNKNETTSKQGDAATEVSESNIIQYPGPTIPGGTHHNNNIYPVLQGNSPNVYQSSVVGGSAASWMNPYYQSHSMGAPMITYENSAQGDWQTTNQLRPIVTINHFQIGGPSKTDNDDVDTPSGLFKNSGRVVKFKGPPAEETSKSGNQGFGFHRNSFRTIKSDPKRPVQKVNPFLHATPKPQKLNEMRGTLHNPYSLASGSSSGPTTPYQNLGGCVLGQQSASQPGFNVQKPQSNFNSQGWRQGSVRRPRNPNSIWGTQAQVPSELSMTFPLHGQTPSTKGTSTKPSDHKRDSAAQTILQEIPGLRETYLYKYECITSQDEVYGYITTYIQNSQDHGFRIQVQNVVRVVRDKDYDFKYIPEKKDRFRLMLWHGTKKEAIADIFKNGFQKPIPKGQMFGSGIYFADRASKSARYCFGGSKPTNPPRNSIAYLLLCDVMIGKSYNAKKAHIEYECAPATTQAQYDSVKCTGEKIPDLAEQIEFDGTKWPVGKTVRNTKFKRYTVRFNEFIVYDPNNVKVKYVVKVSFA